MSLTKTRNYDLDFQNMCEFLIIRSHLTFTSYTGTFILSRMKLESALNKKKLN